MPDTSAHRWLVVPVRRMPEGDCHDCWCERCGAFRRVVVPTEGRETPPIFRHIDGEWGDEEPACHSRYAGA